MTGAALREQDRWRVAQQNAATRLRPCPRHGLGADFSTLVQIPEFQSAWGDVQNQIQAEGGSQLDLQSAQDTLVKTYSDLTTGQFGVDTSSALASAKQYTLAAKTIAGAVDHVEGLINAAKNISDPAQVVATFQMFTGTLIGLASAAGAFSAGVGALIVAGIGEFMSILQGAGLFGSAPVGTQVCPNIYCVTPDWVIGCNCVWGARVQPGAAAWRRFPDAGDTFWFGPPQDGTGVVGQGVWQGAKFNGSSFGVRPIDLAFANYYYLETEMARPSPPGFPDDFRQAFWSAWKANQEYALNGLQVQPDWQVLMHAVRVWNRSHEQGTPFAVSQVAMNTSNCAASALPSCAFGVYAPPNAWGPLPAPHGPAPPMYISALMGDVLNNVPANDPSNYISNGALQIYTGPLKVTKKLVALRFVGTQAAAAASQSASSSGSSGAQTAGLVIAGVGVAGVLGTAIVSWATGKTIDTVLSGFWRTLTGKR